MTWLKWCKRVDLSVEPYVHTNGPFGNHGPFLGVVLHVNVDEHGTSDSFFESNPDEVTPNFQVYKSEAEGGVHQYLPLEYQPWCQIEGNFQYAAIETAGEPDEPLTAYQITAIAKILQAYQGHLGMKLQIADEPGEAGFGTHQMGGAAWGGHPCPGTIRAGQRQQILNVALGKDEPLSDLSADAIAQIAKAVWAEPIPYKGVTANASTWLAAANRYAQSANELLGTAKTGVLSRVAALQAAVSSLSIGGVDTDALIAKIRAITWGAK